MKFNPSPFAQLLFLAVSSVGLAHASDSVCSNATLNGKYAFTISGQILAPAPAAGVVDGVALTRFDGQGNMNQLDHVAHNGVLPIEEWRPGVGPYEVNPDCTGWFIIEPKPTDPADGGPELKLYFVIADNGRLIRTVVSGSPSSAAFVSTITSIGTKVQDCP